MYGGWLFHFRYVFSKCKRDILVLIGAVERYRDRTGHYPQRILADKIYRNRENLTFCKQHGIRLSGPALGRPKKNAMDDKKTEYADNADRVEVEWAFSLAKRWYGLGRIMTKLDITTRGSIALSILAMNVDRLVSLSLFQFLISLFSRYKQHGFMLIRMQNNHCEI